MDVNRQSNLESEFDSTTAIQFADPNHISLCCRELGKLGQNIIQKNYLKYFDINFSNQYPKGILSGQPIGFA